MWEGGSFGSGDLNGTAVLAYVASSMTGVEDPPDINSSFQEHDYFNFFGVDLSTAHSSSYSQYVGGGSGTTTAAPPPSTSTVPPSTTSSAPSGAQSAVRSCLHDAIAQLLTLFASMDRLVHASRLIWRLR